MAQYYLQSGNQQSVIEEPSMIDASTLAIGHRHRASHIGHRRRISAIDNGHRLPVTSHPMTR